MLHKPEGAAAKQKQMDGWLGVVGLVPPSTSMVRLMVHSYHLGADD